MVFLLPQETKIFKSLLDVVDTGGFRQHFIGKPIKEKEVDEALKLLEVYIEDLDREIKSLKKRQKQNEAFYDEYEITKDILIPKLAVEITMFLTRDDILFLKEQVKLFPQKLNPSNVVLVVLKILERRGLKPSSFYTLQVSIPYSLRSVYKKSGKFIDRFEYLELFKFKGQEVADKVIEILKKKGDNRWEEFLHKTFEDIVIEKTRDYLLSELLIPIDVRAEDNTFALEFARANWKELHDFSIQSGYSLSTCSLTYTLTFLEIYEALELEWVISDEVKALKSKKERRENQWKVNK